LEPRGRRRSKPRPPPYPHRRRFDLCSDSPNLAVPRPRPQPGLAWRLTPAGCLRACARSRDARALSSRRGSAWLVSRHRRREADRAYSLVRSTSRAKSYKSASNAAVLPPETAAAPQVDWGRPRRSRHASQKISPRGGRERCASARGAPARAASGTSSRNRAGIALPRQSQDEAEESGCPSALRPAAQQERLRWARRVPTGSVECGRCGHLIGAGEPWNLGHIDGDPDRYSGPEHARC
jgi:hypothetical protein